VIALLSSQLWRLLRRSYAVIANEVKQSQLPTSHSDCFVVPPRNDSVSHCVRPWRSRSPKGLPKARVRSEAIPAFALHQGNVTFSMT
jgi:hypothetical protein